MLCVSMLVHAFSVMLAFVEHKVNVQLLTYLSSRVFVYLSESTRREITKTQAFYAFAVRQSWRRRYVFMLFRRNVTSVRPVRYCYHDISWTAWIILIKLTRNIYQPLLTTWLDSGGQRSRSQQAVANCGVEVHIPVTSTTFGGGVVLTAALFCMSVCFSCL